MKKVVTMSRRTDMYWHPEKLIRILNEKYPPARVHTVVCLTKFPRAVYRPPFRDVLRNYVQVFVHLTVTGLGGTPLEPRVPGWETTLAELPALLDFVGTPARVRLRPDPLLVVKKGGNITSNLETAAEIIHRAGEWGIKSFSTSFLEEYPKVKNRLQRHGYNIVTLPPEERKEVIARLQAAANCHGGTVYTCCVPGLPTSACIDGKLLTRLHPRREECSHRKAAGQRKLCGCTESVDIGWYNMTCRSGCLYCYASPQTA